MFFFSTKEKSGVDNGKFARSSANSARISGEMTNELSHAASLNVIMQQKVSISNSLLPVFAINRCIRSGKQAL